jgi:hypothetical protein
VLSLTNVSLRAGKAAAIWICETHSLSPTELPLKSTKYRGSFNTLVFGEIKPYSGSLKDGRLDLVYYRDPGLNVGDEFSLWTLH